MHPDCIAILTANSDFYTAFAGRCVECMEKLWSRQNDITCIHQGWPPLNGRQDVMASWQCILNIPPLLTGYSKASAYRHGVVGYVTCCEHYEPGILSVTNIFILEDKDWRMVHHQAGILPEDLDNADFGTPETMQ
jgi:hypothetical protein